MGKGTTVNNVNSVNKKPAKSAKKEVAVTKKTETIQTTTQAPMSEKKKKVFDYMKPIVDLQKRRPRFLKPTYFLETLTPFVSVRIHIVGGNLGLNIIELSPPSMSLNNNEEGVTAYNANIKHFNYNPKKLEMSVIFTDVDIMAMETLGTLLNRTSEIEFLVEVEFGWAYPQENKSVRSMIGNENDDGIEAKCFFRRTVYMEVQNVEMEYTNGSADIIISGTKTVSFPEPFNNFLPYDFLGKFPAITLQMIHTLFAISVFMTKMTNVENLISIKKNTVINKEYKQLLDFLYFEKQITDIDTLVKLIQKVFRFYRNDLWNIIKEGSSLIKATSTYINTLKKREADLLKNPKNFIPTLKDQMIFSSISQMVTSLVATNNQIISKEDTTGDKKKNIKKLYDDVYKITLPTQGTEKVINTNDTTETIFGGSLFDIHENLRNAIRQFDKEFSTPLRDLVIELQSCLSSSKIHPWDVFKFCRDAFKVHHEKFKNVEVPSYSESKMTEIQNSQYLEIINFNASDDNIHGYLEGQNNQYHDYSNKALNFIDSSAIIIQPKTNWDELFNSIARQVYTKVDSKTFQEISNTSDEDLAKTKEFILPIKTNLNLVYRKEAIEKLNIYKILIQSRAEKAGAKKEEEDKINNTIKEVQRMNYNAPIFINYFDVNPTAGTLFGNSLGKSSIVQAYSYRTGGALQKVDEDNYGRFNPGYPNVLSINFPDVRNFNVKFNYQDALNQMKSCMRETVPKTDLVKEESNISALAKETKDSKKTSSKESASEKIAENKAKKEEETKKSEAPKVDNTITDFQKYNKLLPYKHPSSLLYTKNIRSGSAFMQALQEKKQMQEYRNILMMTIPEINATLSILGDPLYDMDLQSSYIFLKVLNPDGSLSFFTGLYRVNDMNHEITAGSFVTTLEISKDVTNPDAIDQMYMVVTESDNITVK